MEVNRAASVARADDTARGGVGADSSERPDAANGLPDVHTNTIEGAWALFKRGVAGSFHKVSRKHLDRYLDEFEFRFNNRNNPFIFRDALRELLTVGPLEYRELVGQPQTA